MAYSNTRTFFGVCGNFRFKIFTITDAQSTNSIVNPDMNVEFVNSTNTTDNADTLVAQKLNWTGTCDGNVANKLVDSSETFVPEITGSAVFQTDDTLQGFVEYSTDTDRLLLKWKEAAADLCPDGNEGYIIYDDHKIMLTPVTTDDDGTLIVFGR